MISSLDLDLRLEHYSIFGFASETFRFRRVARDSRRSRAGAWLPVEINGRIGNNQAAERGATRCREMLYCVNCGSSLTEESTLCVKCGFPVTLDGSRTPAESRAAARDKYSATPPGNGHHIRMWFPVFLAVLATAALYATIRMKSDPSGIEIVKRHFVFYDEYAHGSWQRTPCQVAGHEKCVEVRYTVAVQGCGPVTFSWQVFPTEDDLNYEGALPRVNETKYAFYAFLVKDSGTLIPAQALGKPVPESCQYR
jgi:hypothetical protein